MSVLLSFLLFFILQCNADDPLRPFPLPDAHLSTTSILNHSQYVQNFDDPQWYLDNIPFVDFPDQSITDVYYYRTSVIKRHLKFAHEGHGWSFTEFIHPVSWASKLQTIPDSAGHHIVEGRWLRNIQYVKDLITLYTRAGIEAVSGISYTHYIHRAIYEHAQVTGDSNFLTSQLDGMIKMYELWNIQFNNETGLYHRTPLSDAQEYSLPGYVTGGPNGGPVQQWNSFDNDYLTIWLGPETYRPNHNAYMLAAARTIAEIAQLAGNSSVARQWNSTAETLYTKMLNLLWSDELQIWIDVIEGTNMKVEGRELIAYFPFRFDVGTNDTFVRGLEAGLDSDGFITAYGPTTLEQRNEYYTEFKNTTYCCIWQGQSWPFSTSVYLTTLALIARQNRSSVVTPLFFQQAFINYTITNYKEDTPYTAESHYPTINEWSGDSTNHSEHYLHSTYLDNIFTNFIGIVPTLEDRFIMQPLVPSNWSNFAIENLPYHGTLLSILWDQTGSHYPSLNHTRGLSIYSNGSLIHNQPTLANIDIPLPNGHEAAQQLATQPRYDNILANPNSPWGLPSVTADYRLALNGDISPWEAWKMNDGLLWYDITPDNRWTNNQSTTPFNTINITLPRSRSLNSVSLAIYDDTARNGVIACPDAITITTYNGSVLANHSPWSSCVPNALNTILLNANTTGPIETDFLQIRLVNQIHYAVAVTEIQIFVPANTGPRYEAEDGLLGTFIGGFEGRASGMNCTIQGGGVLLGDGAWAELADVRAKGGAGLKNVTVVGGGTGTVAVQMNFLMNATVEFDGAANKTVEVQFLDGGNVVTMLQVSGRPWVDAIVVE